MDSAIMAARHPEGVMPATYGSLHENATYLEERRRTRSTRGSRSNLADELPGSFQLVDTASSPPNEPADARTSVTDTAGTDFVRLVVRDPMLHTAQQRSSEPHAPSCVTSVVALHVIREAGQPETYSLSL